jgi:hypothetical protein
MPTLHFILYLYIHSPIRLHGVVLSLVQGQLYLTLSTNLTADEVAVFFNGTYFQVAHS